MRATVHHILGKNGVIISTINEQIQEIDRRLSGSEIKYSDINTLLGQIIKQALQKKEGITSYWNNDPSFFIDKTIVLKDPKTLKSYSGNIVNCCRDDQNKLILTFDNGTE